jgi:membrane-associated phospholipid phosphatase
MIHHYIKRTATKVWASIALLSIEVIILLIVFLAGLSGFLLLADHIVDKEKFKFDEAAFNIVASLVSKSLTQTMWYITHLGNHDFLIPANILLVIYFLLIKKHRWYSIKIPVVALSSLLLMFGLKLGFHRARPLQPLLFKAAGYSFPSGHALMSMTFYGLLIYLIWQHVKKPWKKWALTVALALLILLIGISRIYFRVHYASDVIAGYSLGIAWLILSLTIVKRIEIFSLRKVDPIVETGPGPKYDKRLK